MQSQLDEGSYVSPADASATFRDYAADWRKSRTHDVWTAERIGRELCLHAYPVMGDRTLRDLAKRPSLTRAWIKGLSIAPGTARQIIHDVSSVFIAAIVTG